MMKMKKVDLQDLLTVEELVAKSSLDEINEKLLNSRMKLGSLGTVIRDIGIRLCIVTYHGSELFKYLIDTEKALNWPVFDEPSRTGEEPCLVNTKDDTQALNIVHSFRMRWAEFSRKAERTVAQTETTFSRLHELLHNEYQNKPYRFTDFETEHGVLFSPMGEIVGALLGWHLCRFESPNLETYKDLLRHKLVPRNGSFDDSSLSGLLTKNSDPDVDQDQMMPSAWHVLSRSECRTWGDMLEDVGLGSESEARQRETLLWLAGEYGLVRCDSCISDTGLDTQGDVCNLSSTDMILKIVQAIDKLRGNRTIKEWERLFHFNLGTHLFWMAATREKPCPEPYIWTAVPLVEQKLPTEKDTISATALLIMRWPDLKIAADVTIELETMKRIFAFTRILMQAETRKTLYEDAFTERILLRHSHLENEFRNLLARQIKHEGRYPLENAENYLLKIGGTADAQKSSGEDDNGETQDNKRSSGESGNADLVCHLGPSDPAIKYALGLRNLQNEFTRFADESGKSTAKEIPTEQFSVILSQVLMSQWLSCADLCTRCSALHGNGYTPTKNGIYVRYWKVVEATFSDWEIKPFTTELIGFLSGPDFGADVGGYILPKVRNNQCDPGIPWPSIFRVVLHNLVKNSIHHCSLSTVPEISYSTNELVIANNVKQKDLEHIEHATTGGKVDYAKLAIRHEDQKHGKRVFLSEGVKLVEDGLRLCGFRGVEAFFSDERLTLVVSFSGITNTGRFEMTTKKHAYEKGVASK